MASGTVLVVRSSEQSRRELDAISAPKVMLAQPSFLAGYEDYVLAEVQTAEFYVLRDGSENVFAVYYKPAQEPEKAAANGET